MISGKFASSAVVSQTSFRGETSSSVAKSGLFSQANTSHCNPAFQSSPFLSISAFFCIYKVTCVFLYCFEHFFYLYARLAMGGFFLNCSTTVSKVSLISYLFNYNLNRNNAVCCFCFSPERRTSENNGSPANQTQTRKSV